MRRSLKDSCFDRAIAGNGIARMASRRRPCHAADTRRARTVGTRDLQPARMRNCCRCRKFRRAGMNCRAIATSWSSATTACAACRSPNYLRRHGTRPPLQPERRHCGVGRAGRPGDGALLKVYASRHPLFSVLALALCGAMHDCDRRPICCRCIAKRKPPTPSTPAARATYMAGQEKLPQGLSGLAAGGDRAGEHPVQRPRHLRFARRHQVSSAAIPDTTPTRLTVTATQPLFRYQNWITYEQAKNQVSQAEATFLQANQDLILRVAQAYFDVLLAENNVTLAGAQKTAFAEQLAQAKRNFEVGTATITDANDAQARHDLAVSQEIAAQNDLEIKKQTLRQIIGRAAAGSGEDRHAASSRNCRRRTTWISGWTTAPCSSLQVKIAQANARHRRAGRLQEPRRSPADARCRRHLQRLGHRARAFRSGRATTASIRYIGAAARGAALPGRTRQFQGARGAGQPGQGQAGSREHQAHGSAQHPHRISGRDERRRADQGVGNRAGLEPELARFDQARPGSRRAERRSTCSTPRSS